MTNGGDPEDFYRRHYRPYPWTPGYRLLPPWLIGPVNISALFALWLGMTFGVRGEWSNVAISLAVIFCASACWAIWMRHESKRAGVPVTSSEWRALVERCESAVSATPRSPVGPFTRVASPVIAIGLLAAGVLVLVLSDSGVDLAAGAFAVVLGGLFWLVAHRR